MVHALLTGLNLVEIVKLGIHFPGFKIILVYMSILNPNKKQVMWIIHCMSDQVHFGKEALKNLNG